MRLAGKNKRRELLEKAKSWLENSESALFFADAKSTVIMAIAEYMASQEGLTIYNRKPGHVRL